MLAHLVTRGVGQLAEHMADEDMREGSVRILNTTRHGGRADLRKIPADGENNNVRAFVTQGSPGSLQNGLSEVRAGVRTWNSAHRCRRLSRLW